MPGSDDNPLTPTKGDVGLTLGRAAVAGVPLVGGSIAELLGLVRSPLSKRLEAWCDQVNRGLAELREQREGPGPDSLAENEQFVSAVQHATQIAARTHQQEKLEALRNAVLNVAAGAAPNDDLQLMFLSFVDTFTTLHLRMLKFFHMSEKPDPPKRPPELPLTGRVRGPNTTPLSVLGRLFPVAKGTKGFCDQVYADLIQRSLLRSARSKGPTRAVGHDRESDWLHTPTDWSDLYTKRTTPLGDAFLAFIENPKPVGE